VVNEFALRVFQIHVLTPLKESWICLVITCWLCAALFLIECRCSFVPFPGFRTYMTFWMFGIFSYQTWWNLACQILLDSVGVLAALEAVYFSVFTLTVSPAQRYSRLRMAAIAAILFFAVVAAVPRAYPGISQSVYFIHLYSCAAAGGLLIGSALQSWWQGTTQTPWFIKHVWLLAMWFSAQFAAGLSHDRGIGWFVIGCARTSVQIGCLIGWIEMMRKDSRRRA
jgi:hypothetical protein